MLTVRCFLLLSFLCVGLWAAPLPVPAADGGLEEAQQLIRTADYEAALVRLRVLIRKNPNDRDARFFLGLAAVALAESPETARDRRDALLDEAIESFYVVLVSAPGWQRARLEFAYALFLRGRHELAEQNFERVLVSEPPAYIVANIQRVLAQIRTSRRWSGYFSFSIAPDTNINNATESETIELFGLPFTLSDSARSQSGVGLLSSGGGEYRLPLNDSWSWRFGVDGVHSEYSGGEFDQTYLAARSGPRYLLSRQSELSMQAVFGRRWIGGQPYSDEIGLRLDPLWRISRYLTLRGLMFLRDRRHEQSTELDGVHALYTLEGQYLLTSTLLLNVSGGVSESRSKNISSRNIRRRVRMGADWALPLGWSVGGDVEWEDVRHKGRSFFVPGNGRRVDHVRSIRLRVLNRALTFYGFSPQLLLLRELQTSNSVLHDYQRSRLELRSVRQF